MYEDLSYPGCGFKSHVLSVCGDRMFSQCFVELLWFSPQSKSISIDSLLFLNCPQCERVGVSATCGLKEVGPLAL